MKTDLKSLTYEQLENFIVSLNEPKFRAKQIYKWLYSGVESFNEMSDISKQLRTKLDDTAYISTLKVRKKLVSEIDGTIKFLFELADNNFVECVLMSYNHGNSICISTQVGCNMKCGFCASGLLGKSRDLSAGEIIDQYIFASKFSGKKISSIVLMGMGEPLDNYENVLIFLKNINDERGINLSHRHISLSTCGLADKIMQLADLKLQITLSVSLHAPNDIIRSEMMPINKKYNIDTLLDACRYYISKTNRRISFEYTMINGVNDTEQCANQLAQKLSGMLCHINLIPVNNVSENEYIRSSKNKIYKFKNELEKMGLNVTIRRELGKDINASCGQLRKSEQDAMNIKGAVV